jgi:hypothetical protein
LEYKCTICGELIAPSELRTHLEEHNAQADKLAWEEVVGEFILVDTPAK